MAGGKRIDQLNGYTISESTILEAIRTLPPEDAARVIWNAAEDAISEARADGYDSAAIEAEERGN